MAEQLVIRFDPSRPDRAAWMVVDAHGRAVIDPARGELADAAPLAAQRRVVALVPGADVLLARVRVPVRSQARIQQVLPYALEEQLVEDLEALHFAAGVRNADGEVTAVAVSAERLEAWLADLESAGITPQAVYADSQAIPVNPGSLTVVLEGARAYVAPPDGVPTVFDGLTLEQVLGIVEAEADSPTHLLVYCDAHHDRHLRDYWEALRDEGRGLDVHLLGDGGVLPRMAAGITSSPGVNLLQGAYAPRSAYRELWPHWRIAAMLLVAFGLVAVTVKSVEYVRLQQAVNALDAEIETVFTRTFGDVPVSDYRRYIRQQIGGAPGESDQRMLEVLDTLGRVVADSERARVTNISYRRGVMDVRLRVPDVDTLDGIRRRIVEDGFDSEIQAANPVDDGVEGRLQLSRRGA